MTRLALRPAATEAVAPITGLLALAIWLPLAGLGRLDIVHLRDDTFATSAYGVAVMVGFGVVLASARARPAWSVTLLVALLLVQLLFWPARFSQLSWSGYLLLLPLPAFLSWSTPPHLRRRVLAAVLACATAVGALLAVPALSLSGRWGTVSGKELAGGLDAVALCLALSVVCAWLGWRAGRPRVAPLPPARSRDHVGSGPAEAAVSGLSPREREVFGLVALGRSNADIASDAFISEATVKTHVGSILRKLGLVSRSELIAFAWRHRLVDPAEDD